MLQAKLGFPLKILLVHPHANVFRGGELVGMYVAKVLAERHKVTLLTDRFDERKLLHRFGLSLTGIRVLMVTHWELRPILPKVGGYQSLAWRELFHDRLVERIIRSNGYDAIFSTWDLECTPRTETPTLLYCHFPYLAYHNSVSLVDSAYYALPDRLLRRRIESLRVILANSIFTRDHILSHWRRDADVVYPPCPPIQNDPERKEDLVVTIGIGKYRSSRRYEVLFEIARLLNRSKFFLIGTLQDTPELDAGYSPSGYYNLLLESKPENVELCVDVSRRVLEDYLRRAKVYLHITENEPFGVSVVEAMSAGCIPVVHKSGGPLETVDPECGYFWRTPNQAATQISEILADEALRKTKSSVAVDVAKRFEPGLFEEKIRAIVANMLT